MAQETDWIHDGPYGHLHLRDFFAAFALAAVIGLDLEESAHSTDAAYAYNAADAMMAERERRMNSETETKTGGSSER